tara:strand:- start:1297 stop:3312 length:2016 start_codon:yes stop_codon:yes gene_type:complete
MKNITAKQESLSNWREEISVNEAKIDDVKYGKGKGWDQPENKRVDSYKSRHSYLKKNPPNVRSDRNKRHSEQDVLWHGHDYTERKRKKKHFDGRNVKTTNTPESDKKKKNKKDIGEDVQSTVKKVLDRGTEFVEKNPVGKVLGAIVAPVNNNKGKNYPTKAENEKNIGESSIPMYDENGKKIDPNSDEWYKFPVYDKDGKLIKDPKNVPPTDAAKTVNAEEFIPLNVYSTAVNYFYEQGINEDGLDLIIEEVGVETFTDFILDLPEQLNEERSAKKAPKRDYEKVKASVYKKDAARKEKGTGEYSKTKAAKDKYGDEEAPEGAPEKKVATKKKVKKSVAKAKTKQSPEPASKKGLGDRIKSAYKEGVKRHRKATQGARVFGKGFASGAKKAVKFAKDVHSAVSEEIQGGVSVETYTKDTKFMEIETLDVITAKPLRSDWRGDLKELAIDKRITTTKGEFGKPGFSMNVRQMSDKELSDKLPTIGGVKLEMDQDGNLPNLGQFVSDTARTQANNFADSGIIDNNQTVGAAMGAKAGLNEPMTGDQFKQLAQDGTKDLAFNINKEIKGTTANRLQGVADNINKSTSNLKGKLSTSSGAITNSYSWRDELYLGERLGGKGYKSYTSLTGEKVSGDWEDSDRGGGHKWQKRINKPVKKKSPTYLAHVRNKDKKNK